MGSALLAREAAPKWLRVNGRRSEKNTVCWGVEWKEASKKWLNEQMSTGTQKAEGV